MENNENVRLYKPILHTAPTIVNLQLASAQCVEFQDNSFHWLALALCQGSLALVSSKYLTKAT
jgi:hypothetical protein